MTHRPVKSSNILSIAHEGTTMQVRFKCGACDATGLEPNAAKGESCPKCKGWGHTGTYTYEGVPSEIHRRVMLADSVGGEFDKLIRKGSYKVTKP